MKLQLPASVGVSFSGGLARVPAQIGMYQRLHDVGGVSADLAVGCSTGAINAAFLAQNPRDWAGRAERFWIDVAQDRGLTSMWRSTMRSLTTSAANRTRKLMRRQLELAFGDIEFDQLELPLTVVCTDLDSGAVVALRRGPVVDALLATTAFPIVTPPMAIGDRYLVDGSLVSGVPISELLTAKAASVVVLDCGSSAVDEQEAAVAGWHEVMALAATHMLRVQAHHDIAFASRQVPVIRLACSQGSPFDFKGAPDQVVAGERAAAVSLSALATRPGQKSRHISKPGLYGAVEIDS